MRSEQGETDGAVHRDVGMPELGEAEHIRRRHVVIQRDLDMELEPPARPVSVLRTDDHMEVRQGVGVIKLYLHTWRLVLLQLLYLQISPVYSLPDLDLSLYTSFTNNLSLIETLLDSSFFDFVGLLPSDSCLSLLVSVIMVICNVYH